MNLDDITRNALNRWQDCKIISAAAQSEGLAASPEHVNRFYHRYRQWYEGRLAKGYLIKITGVKQTKKG